jgi:hypothetical protein
MTPLKKLLTGTTSLSYPGHLVRDPITIGNAILATIGVQTSSIALIYAAGYLATTVVTSWALSALAPRPPAGADLRGTLINTREADAPHDYVYGTVRKGGVITYVEATGANNKFLHIILTLAGHEVEAIDDVYIDDQVATIDGSGFVTSQSWDSKIRIVKYTGSQTTAPALLLAESGQINSNFIGRGIAYLYIRLEYDTDVFPNGIPLFTAVVRGKKVYDPRTATTAFSANAALCVRDYITSSQGLGDPSVNDTTFTASANVCDENVTLSVGGTEKRYTMNGVMTADMTPGDVLQKMMTACAGTTFWGQGEWQLKVGYYTAPVKTLTLDDLRGPISLQTRISMGSIFNSVTGTFNDASQAYVVVDYPKRTSATFLAEDNGVDSPIDLALPFTTSAATAQRIAKMTLFRGREQMVLSADFGLAAFSIQVGDIVAMTIDRYGWSAKEFEVVGWSFFADGEAGDLRVRLELRETSEAAFDWAAEESAILANNTNLPSSYITQTVGLSLVYENRVYREKITTVIRITTTVTDELFVDRVEVEGKLSSDPVSAFVPLGSGPLGIYEWIDVNAGFYDIRARSISQLGVKSAWNTVSNFQVAGISTEPDDVANLSVNLNGGTLNLDWDALGSLDLSYYLVRHALEESGATFGSATTAVPKVSRPATSVALPTRPGTYMIKAYDKTGNASSNYTSIVVPSAALETFTNNLTDTESPTFPGTKTGCSVTSSSLRITTTSPAPTSATYEFTGYIDTGAVRRVRSRVDINLVRLDSNSTNWDTMFPSNVLWDSWPGFWDDWSGSSGIADVDVVSYISVTEQDPAGTPTWSAWQRFKAGDFYGRAFKFKVELISTTAGVTPSITGLTARVQY